MPNKLIVNGELLLTGTVGKLWWDDEGFTYRDVAEALLEMPDGKVPVRINSGGGSAFEGLAIHALLKQRGCDVTVDGIAASAASLIAMAGETVTISQGAMMMIHDAKDIAWGTEDDLKKSSEMLGKLSNNYAAIYAAKSGKTVEDVRSLMKAETWFTADEAVAQGFATAIEGQSATATAFAYDLYRAAPAALPRRALPASPAAHAALPKEKTMPLDPNKQPEMNKPADTPTPPAPVAGAGKSEAGKSWAHDIYLAADKAGLTIAEANAVVIASATADAAKDAIIDAVAAKHAGAQPGANAQRSHVSADEGEKFRKGVSAWLGARGGLEAHDPQNNWNGASLLTIASAVASRDGRLTSHDPQRIIRAAVAHSSGDFPLILENVAGKAMLKGYDEAAETFAKWTSVGSVSDFKVAKRVDLNSFGNLPPKPEGAEYKYLTTGERGEPIQIGTYGGIVPITREAIINDDISAFARIPRKLGTAAKRSVGAAVYAVLTVNPNMSDGKALFHADHKNLVSGAGTALAATAAGVAALDAARAAMAKQTDRSKEAVVLNIRPAYLLVPVALEGVAMQLVGSTSEPGQANPGVKNRAAGLAEVIAEARLDVASATAWYLAAGPAFDTVEVTYLNGVQTPTIERDESFATDGVQFKVRHDFSAAALGWETLYKATGAA